MKTSSMASVLAIGACLLGCGGARTSVREPLRAAEAPTAEAWFDAARQSFDPARPEEAMTPALLSALDGAQVVGIGEASHGTHEDASFKTALILALLDAGKIDTVYLEANRAGCVELDAYLRAPDGDAAEVVKQAAIFRVWKTQAMADLVAGLKERARRGVAVRIVGIDCQDSARDADHALRLLERRDAAGAAEHRAALAKIAGDEARKLRHIELVQRLTVAEIDALIGQLEALEAACGADPEAALCAKRAWQGLASYRLEASDGDAPQGPSDYASLRDKYMAENIVADGHRGAFWGHNYHVAASAPGGTLEGFVTSGSFLRRTLESRYRAVLFDYRHARVLALVFVDGEGWPSPDGQRETLARGPFEDGLQAALGRGSDESFWIDMARLPHRFAAWRDAPRSVEWPGSTTTRERTPEMSATLPFDDMADVMVVIDRLSEARALP